LASGETVDVGQGYVAEAGVAQHLRVFKAATDDQHAALQVDACRANAVSEGSLEEIAVSD
jgi:hypothetical protein